MLTDAVTEPDRGATVDAPGRSPGVEVLGPLRFTPTVPGAKAAPGRTCPGAVRELCSSRDPSAPGSVPRNGAWGALRRPRLPLDELAPPSSSGGDWVRHGVAGGRAPPRAPH